MIFGLFTFLMNGGEDLQFFPLLSSQMQDVLEREEERELMRQYTTAPARSNGPSSDGSSSGFVLRNAPWSSGALGDEEQFPSFGGGADRNAPVRWGPRRR